MKHSSRKKFFPRFILGLCSIFLLLFLIQDSKAQPIAGFIRTQGTSFVDEKGNIFYIKGINFFNNINQNPSLPPTTDHTEDSYREISALGFNTIRFYLNYGIFEDDANPYNYKQTAWDWIDQNIAWAKKYNIRLILDMHITQGDYQEDKTLWTDLSVQKRLIRLHGAIAKRYANEPTVLGYGLKNEPAPQANGTLSANENLYNLYTYCIQRIRSVDQNHIIFIENTRNLYADGFSIPDDNWAYEAHMYDTIAYTHQGVYHNTEEATVTYPNTIQKWYGKYQNISYGERSTYYDISDSKEWQKITAETTIQDPEANCIHWELVSGNSNTDTSIYVDDITIDAYDKNNNYVSTIYSNTFDTEKNITFRKFLFSSADEATAAMSYHSTIGYKKAGSIMVSKQYTSGLFFPNDADNAYFPVKNGYTYKLTAWMKISNPTKKDNATYASIRLNTGKIPYRGCFDKNYLEAQLTYHLTYSNAFNVPCYIGEFGTSATTFQNNLGGAQWVTDMLSLFDKYDVHFCYHDYHGGWNGFSLYNSDYRFLPSSNDLNQVLFDLFKTQIPSINQ